MKSVESRSAIFDDGVGFDDLHLDHSKADTTVNVYMQSIGAGVKQTLDAIYSELTTPEMRAEL